MAIKTLPNPPKFGTEGPQSISDWTAFYRWLQSVYVALQEAGSNSQQAINLPVYPNSPQALAGQLAGLSWLAFSAYSRPSSGGRRTSTAYVAAASPEPWLIPAGVHGQGAVFTVQCYMGPVVNGAPTGTMAYPEIDLDPSGSGDVTIIYGANDVGCVVIQG